MAFERILLHLHPLERIGPTRLKTDIAPDQLADPWDRHHRLRLISREWLDSPHAGAARLRLVSSLPRVRPVPDYYLRHRDPGLHQAPQDRPDDWRMGRKIPSPCRRNLDPHMVSRSHQAAPRARHRLLAGHSHHQVVGQRLDRRPVRLIPVDQARIAPKIDPRRRRRRDLLRLQSDGRPEAPTQDQAENDANHSPALSFPPPLRQIPP